MPVATSAVIIAISTVPTPAGVICAEPASLAVMNATLMPMMVVWSSAGQNDGILPVTAQAQAHRATASKARLKNAINVTQENCPKFNDTWSSLLTCSTSLSAFFHRRLLIHRSTVRVLQDAQYNPPHRPSINAREATSDQSATSAPQKNTPVKPINTTHSVEIAEESTKNQPHSTTDAPQARCTLYVKIAANAGPPGSVVDQALEAKTMLLHSLNETGTPPATNNLRITSAIANRESAKVINTTTMGQGCA